MDDPSTIAKKLLASSPQVADVVSDPQEYTLCRQSLGFDTHAPGRVGVGATGSEPEEAVHAQAEVVRCPYVPATRLS
jgi:hypothetical protein